MSAEHIQGSGGIQQAILCFCAVSHAHLRQHVARLQPRHGHGEHLEAGVEVLAREVVQHLLPPRRALALHVADVAHLVRQEAAARGPARLAALALPRHTDAGGGGGEVDAGHEAKNDGLVVHHLLHARQVALVHAALDAHELARLHRRVLHLGRHRGDHLVDGHALDAATQVVAEQLEAVDRPLDVRVVVRLNVHDAARAGRRGREDGHTVALVHELAHEADHGLRLAALHHLDRVQAVAALRQRPRPRHRALLDDALASHLQLPAWAGQRRAVSRGARRGSLAGLARTDCAPPRRGRRPPRSHCCQSSHAPCAASRAGPARRGRAPQSPLPRRACPPPRPPCPRRPAPKRGRKRGVNFVSSYCGGPIRGNATRGSGERARNRVGPSAAATHRLILVVPARHRLLLALGLRHGRLALALAPAAAFGRRRSHVGAFPVIPVVAEQVLHHLRLLVVPAFPAANAVDVALVHFARAGGPVSADEGKKSGGFCSATQGSYTA